MQKGTRSFFTRMGLAIFFVLIFLPITSFAQRRWVVVRPRRSRVVIYQPQTYRIYRRPAYAYSYAQPYYGTQYYSNGYTQPYYQNQYYSYGYTQPYYSYGYSQPYYVSPNYGYNYYGYRPRYRRSGFRIGIRLR